jgi:UPF0716 protein FxsA
MPALLIIALVLAWPFLEIAAFIWVGGQIGILATLALVLFTTFAGFWLVRLQGLPLIAMARAQLELGEPPVRAVADGAMIAAGGALLMLPGFVTDVIGLALFLPPVRALIFHAFSRRITVYSASFKTAGASSRPRPAPGVIDLDRADWETGNTGDTGSDAPSPPNTPRGPTPWLPPEKP